MRRRRKPQKQRDDFQGKNKAFDEQRERSACQGHGEAKTERERLLDEAHKEADTFRATQAAALENDQARLGQGNHARGPGRSFRHRPKDADGPGHRQPRGARGRSFHAPSGGHGREAKETLGALSGRHPNRPSCSAPLKCLRPREPPSKMRSTRPSQPKCKFASKRAKDTDCGHRTDVPMGKRSAGTLRNISPRSIEKWARC